MRPGTFTEPVQWLYLIYLNATSQALWVTSAGLSATPAPLVTSTPPADLDALVVLDASFPPGTVLTFGFLLLHEGGILASDFVTTVVAGP